jgi:hypothetical protein
VFSWDPRVIERYDVRFESSWAFALCSNAFSCESVCGPKEEVWATGVSGSSATLGHQLLVSGRWKNDPYEYMFPPEKYSFQSILF